MIKALIGTRYNKSAIHNPQFAIRNPQSAIPGTHEVGAQSAIIITVFFCLCLFIPQAKAQFLPYSIQPLEYFPTAVKVGDVTGDDRDDIVLTAWSAFDTGSLVVLPQNLSGGPDLPQRYPTGQAPAGLALGDVNHDGRTDVVIITQGDQRLETFLGTQTGGLETGATYHLEGRPYRVEVGDVNGDDRLDVAVLTRMPEKVVFFIQNESGQLTSLTDYRLPAAPIDITLTDLNYDLRRDIAILTAEDLTFIRQTASGDLTGPVSEMQFDTTLVGRAGLAGMVTGDMNSDGRFDLILFNSRPLPYGGINILLQSEDSLAASPVIYMAYESIQAISVGDVNRDGRDDIITLNGDRGIITLLTQSKDGTLNPYQDFPVPYLPAQSGFQSLALGDVNGDDFLDVVIIGPPGRLGPRGKLIIVLNTAQGPQNITPQPGWPVATGNSVFSSPALGDLDGDGNLEVVIGSHDRKVYAIKSDGAFLDGWPVTTKGIVFSSPGLADLNVDGRSEVVVGSYDNNIYVFNHDGSLFSGWPLLTMSDINSSPNLGDLDGDGAAEIIIGGFDNKVYAYQSNGREVSGWPLETQGDIGSTPLVIDLNGDGGREVIIGSGDGRVYAWDQGGNLLTGWPVSANGEVISSPAAGDINGDGKPEIVVGSTDGRLYAWDANGIRVPGWPVRTGSPIHSSPALADLDRDGKLEIVVGSDDYRIYAFRGDGSNLPNWPVATGGQVRSSPAIADIDGDGELEVVAGSYDGKLYAINPDGSPAPGFPLQVGGELYSSPAIADIDNDGALEVVIGSTNGRIYCFDIGKGRHTPDLSPWPRFHHDNSSTGLYAGLETANLAPAADAGPDVTVEPGLTISLDGSRSLDMGGDRLIYLWAQIEGPPVQLSDIQSIWPTITLNMSGRYIFRLIVNDGHADSKPDTVAVTVIENKPPIASAGHDQEVYGDTKVFLDGRQSSDPEGDILTYRWTQKLGPVVEISSETSPKPSFTPTEIGDYRFELIVNDGRQDSKPDSAAVTVKEEPVIVAPIYVRVRGCEDNCSRFWVDIVVGDDQVPVKDLFGLSFKLNYTHPGIIKADTSSAGDFLGPGVVFHAEADDASGQVGLGISRKLGSDGVEGSGIVARVEFRLTGIIPSGEVIEFNLNDVTAFNTKGKPISLQPVGTVFESGIITVWPGDTNNDGIVDEKDVLPVGQYWHIEGPERYDGSMRWAAQSVMPWEIHESTYADANGDGIVDEKEILAIGLNWHRKSVSSSGHPLPGRLGLAGRRVSSSLIPQSAINSPQSAIRNPQLLGAYQAMYQALENNSGLGAGAELKHFLAEIITSLQGRQIPLRTSLGQSYPNPMNPECFIPFALASEAEVTLRIYTLSGQLIRTLDPGRLPAGTYHSKSRAAYWDGRDEDGREVSSGIYFYQLKAGSFLSVRKMIILR
ncbi:MAG: FG-GAP-like repeat-containing protein [bacterium]|nr:FG-GAP-like repeat-containing protein [bacterium]